MFILMKADPVHLAVIRRDSGAEREGYCLFDEANWVAHAETSQVTRVTFMGHGIARRNGVRLYGSGNEMGGRFPGYTPAQMVELLKVKLPKTVKELDFLGCDIGLGHGGDVKPDKLSWLEELAHRIKLDPDLSSQITTIKGAYLPGCSEDYFRLMVASPERGLGYRAYLLKEAEALQLIVLNERIEEFNKKHDQLTAKKAELAGMLDQLIASMAELTVEREKLRTKVKADEALRPKLTALEQEIVANQAKQDRHPEESNQLNDQATELAASLEAVKKEKDSLLISTSERVENNSRVISECRAYCDSFPAISIDTITEDQARKLVKAADEFWFTVQQQIQQAPVAPAGGAGAATGGAGMSGEFWGEFNPDDLLHSKEEGKLINSDSDFDPEID